MHLQFVQHEDRKSFEPWWNVRSSLSRRRVAYLVHGTLSSRCQYPHRCCQCSPRLLERSMTNIVPSVVISNYETRYYELASYATSYLRNSLLQLWSTPKQLSLTAPVQGLKPRYFLQPDRSPHECRQPQRFQSATMATCLCINNISPALASKRQDAGTFGIHGVGSCSVSILKALSRLGTHSAFRLRRMYARPAPAQFGPSVSPHISRVAAKMECQQLMTVQCADGF